MCTDRALLPHAGTSPDKPALKRFAQPLAAWVKTCPEAFPEQGDVANVLFELQSLHEILGPKGSLSHTVLNAQMNDAADMWGT